MSKLLRPAREAAYESARDLTAEIRISFIRLHASCDLLLLVSFPTLCQAEVRPSRLPHARRSSRGNVQGRLEWQTCLASLRHGSLFSWLAPSRSRSRSGTSGLKARRGKTRYCCAISSPSQCCTSLRTFPSARSSRSLTFTIT